MRRHECVCVCVCMYACMHVYMICVCMCLYIVCVKENLLLTIMLVRQDRSRDMKLLNHCQKMLLPLLADELRLPGTHVKNPLVTSDFDATSLRIRIQDISRPKLRASHKQHSWSITNSFHRRYPTQGEPPVITCLFHMLQGARE